jgi:hypothetical protein
MISPEQAWNIYGLANQVLGAILLVAVLAAIVSRSA